MFKNYCKTAWRSLAKNKMSSFINISGLATGMTVAMLIGLWIYDELSYNTCHQNYDQIAQVLRHYTFEGKKETGGQSNPMALGAALRSSFGKDFTYVVTATKTVNYITSNGDKSFNQKGRFMEPEAPAMLGLQMLQGNRAGLKDMNTILLSASLAKKLFGNADPINRIVKIDTGSNVKVTGVYKDLPVNSEFSDVTFIAPFDLYVSLNTWVQKARNNWRDNSFPIYVQIAPNASFNGVSVVIKNIMLPHLDEAGISRKPEVFLHPMRKWHLYSKFENGINVTSDPLRSIWLYGIIGAFVLVLACINFMNLSTAHSEKRAKEVGIRKAAGSLRIQLIGQFFSESLLVAAFGFITAIILVLLILPWFNGVAGKEISIPWAQFSFWLCGIIFTLFTGLLAGTYPALYLSSFNPVKVLKNSFRTRRFAAMPRKMLIVVQFTVSIALIIGTITVYRQIQFAKNRPVGYTREGLLVLQMITPDLQKNMNYYGMN